MNNHDHPLASVEISSKGNQQVPPIVACSPTILRVRPAPLRVEKKTVKFAKR